MENKINIAEILKKCPSGMELDCVLYDNVVFDTISDGHIYPIKIKTPEHSIFLTKNGCYSDNKFSKCVIFPKGKTTWEGFVPPCKFKNGDIVVTKTSNNFIFYSIYKGVENRKVLTHVDYNFDSNILMFNDNLSSLCFIDEIVEQRFATEEEKQKLFDVIKANGYKWNPETKTLEKLPKTKFKVGDKIQSVISSSYYTVVDIKNDLYFIKSDTEKYPYQVSFSNEINYKLVLDKFDITTLKPFDRVLMRSSNAREWVGTFYSHYSDNKFYGCGMCCDQCIPYERNEHLLGKTDDCDEYFKNW